MDHGSTIVADVQIDVQATLAAELGHGMEQYLLPGNVAVRRDGDRTVVQALDPQVMVSLPGRPELQPVADEAGQRLNATLAAVAAA